MFQNILVKSLSITQSLRWQTTWLRQLGLRGPTLNILHLASCPPLLLKIEMEYHIFPSNTLVCLGNLVVKNIII